MTIRHDNQKKGHCVVPLQVPVAVVGPAWPGCKLNSPAAISTGEIV